jgi:hypothetical protein
MKRPSDIRDLFVYFVEERERIRVMRDCLGDLPPYTEDPTLQKYSFCNVNREHDRVTRWVADNVRNLEITHEQMVLNIAVARIFNEPRTLKHLLPFSKPKSLVMKVARLKRDNPDVSLFRGAYMMPSHGTSGKGVCSFEYWCNNVVSLEQLSLQECDSLRSLSDVIRQAKGFGDFLANQICTDMRYTRFYPTSRTPDWTTFVLAGPGTQRGMARYYKTKPFGPNVFRQSRGCNQERLVALREELSSVVSPNILSHFQDINNLSNCFCEFDKFCRAIDIAPSDTRHRVGLREFKKR